MASRVDEPVGDGASAFDLALPASQPDLVSSEQAQHTWWQFGTPDVELNAVRSSRPGSGGLARRPPAACPGAASMP